MCVCIHTISKDLIWCIHEQHVVLKIATGTMILGEDVQAFVTTEFATHTPLKVQVVSVFATHYNTLQHSATHCNTHTLEGVSCVWL